MKSTLLLAFLFILTLAATAQDKIIKNNAEILNCKVTEIGANEVKYYYAESPKLIFGIDKALVDRIEFGTGEVIEIEENSFRNPEYYVNQSKNALKINFLSPLFGTTEFVYEKSLKPGRSWETALGIVGLGNDIDDIDPRGIYGKFAYKFMRTPDYYMNKMHYSHILKGGYIAPEIAFRYMSFDGYSYNYYYDSSGYYHGSSSSGRESQVTLAIMLKFGKQWVFDDAFLVDLYWGVGYGVGAHDYDGLPYGFIVAPDDFPIALTSGLRIGWVFGK
ncbi:hypothetical protein [Draconibacterium halophilum]|uniref:DUF3575 domain-containing protein n=1 Tax=Draconibacterium halophilum TaxID=2706887 RepID=A0A6C0R9W3_9BACT|nr:hypothetical protein [Draconibacterium halophilum]QIA06756.1 hypothetical protein G0Q07_02980 [Draconibacterium halophilum]